jgi:hypothetical protein
MNITRILLGGLVAGLVLNIGEYLLNEVILGQQMAEQMSRMNLPAPAGSFIAIAVVLTFLLGILMVWLYALIRSRLGPGPKTAVVAALILWLAICVYTGTIYSLLMDLPTNMIVIGIVWCLVEYVLAAIAGAWVYKEVNVDT